MEFGQLWSNNVLIVTSKGQYLYFLVFGMSIRMTRQMYKNNNNTKYYF